MNPGGPAGAQRSVLFVGIFRRSSSKKFSGKDYIVTWLDIDLCARPSSRRYRGGASLDLFPTPESAAELSLAHRSGLAYPSPRQSLRQILASKNLLPVTISLRTLPERSLIMHRQNGRIAHPARLRQHQLQVAVGRARRHLEVDLIKTDHRGRQAREGNVGHRRAVQGQRQARRVAFAMAGDAVPDGTV